ncbi:MAG: hypothetical protein IIU80_01985 [Clostridia bacterium]|jgi:hypothetical protein|nr:hypothetical protein [Clostridia bacterium]
MAYDIVRWGVGLIAFLVFIAVLVLFTKKIGKAVLISAFAAVIMVAVSLLIPVENYFFSFNSVESVYNYRYHEDLLTYAECDEGVFCVGQKDAVSFVYYSFTKDDDGYKLPEHLVSKTVFRSSEHGVYLFETFENQTIIMTQVVGSAYKGEEFKPCSNGYYSFTVVDGELDYSALSRDGERVRLI